MTCCIIPIGEYKGSWTKIENRTEYYMKFSINSSDPNYKCWIMDLDVQQHFYDIKLCILDKLLPMDDYIFLHRNIFINKGPIRVDLSAHSDFPLSLM